MKIKLLTHRFFQRLKSKDWYNDISYKDTGDPVDPKEFFDKRNSPFKVEYDRKEDEENVSKCGWEGSTQTLYAPKKSEVMSLYHDLCHYFACHKSRLKFDDFGLGMGYQSVNLKLEDQPDEYVGYFENCQSEEEVVCYLSLCLAKMEGVDERVIASEMKNVMMEKLYEKSETSVYIDMFKDRKVQKHLKSRYGIELIFPTNY